MRTKALKPRRRRYSWSDLESEGQNTGARAVGTWGGGAGWGCCAHISCMMGMRKASCILLPLAHTLPPLTHTFMPPVHTHGRAHSHGRLALGNWGSSGHPGSEHRVETGRYIRAFSQQETKEQGSGLPGPGAGQAPLHRTSRLGLVQTCSFSALPLLFCSPA